MLHVTLPPTVGRRAGEPPLVGTVVVGVAMTPAKPEPGQAEQPVTWRDLCDEWQSWSFRLGAQPAEMAIEPAWDWGVPVLAASNSDWNWLVY